MCFCGRVVDFSDVDAWSVNLSSELPWTRYSLCWSSQHFSIAGRSICAVNCYGSVLFYFVKDTYIRYGTENLNLKVKISDLCYRLNW